MAKAMAAAAFAALALVTMAAALIHTANAQRDGDVCGPSYDNEGEWRWISISSSRLTATNGRSIDAGVDGCATSDRGPYAHVSAQLPYGSYNIYAVAFRTPASVEGSLEILAGDANTSAHIQALRNGDSSAADLFRHFTRCRWRRDSFNPRERQHTIICNPEFQVSGQWVVLLAKPLTVCDVMICGHQVQFTDDGVPLTRAAALKLRGASTTQPLARSFGPAALPETCPGYTSQKWGKCPSGKECVKTYKPGNGVCSCSKCSAFTEVRHCQQGDTSIGKYSCCFTCPDQRVCAVCQTPCNPVFERIEVTVGVLPSKPSEINALTYSYTSSTQAVNMGTNPQTITVSFSIAQQLTATMTYAEAFQYSEKASVKVGLPLIREGMLEFGAQQTFTTTTTNTAQTTTTYTTALQQQIPPLTLQEVNASARADTITTRVPVTIKTYYTCDKVETKETFAIIKTEGTLSATAAQLSIVYGAQFPIDRPYIYPQADATCASNPVCNDLGIRQGNCCPDERGAYRSCCSFCIAKPACAEYATDNTTMCCPTRTGVLNPCCSA